MKSLKYFLLLLIAFAFITGCQKEEEKASPPEIAILAPTNYSSVSAGDTLHVKATIKDEEGINFYQIRLFDEAMNLKEILYSLSFQNALSTVEIDMDFTISINDLETGICYLQVQAKSADGLNSAYVALQGLSAKPKFKRLVVLSYFDQGPVLGDITAAEGYRPLSYSFDGNVVEVMVNSHSQRIHVLSKQPGQLYTLDANSFESLWMVEPGYTYPVYTDFYVMDDLVFVSSENGEVSAYNAAGVFKYATVQDQEYVPRQFAVSEDYIVTYAERRSGQHKLIRAFYNPSGAFMQHTPLNESIVEIFPAGNKDFLLFGNKEGNAVVLSYNVENNKYVEIDSFQGEVLSIDQISGTAYIIKTGNGWYRYNAQANSSVPLPYLNSKEIISYDVLGEIIFATAGSEVEMIDASTGNLQDIIEAQPLILDMDILYNKNP